MNLNTVGELLEVAQDEALYTALILQLNKDFIGVLDVTIPLSLSPSELKSVLCKHVEYLLLKDTAGYQNLLYRIDVSEKKIKFLERNETAMYIESVVFLILKREWQKVWFRNKL